MRGTVEHESGMRAVRFILEHTCLSPDRERGTLSGHEACNTHRHEHNPRGALSPLRAPSVPNQRRGPSQSSPLHFGLTATAMGTSNWNMAGCVCDFWVYMLIAPCRFFKATAQCKKRPGFSSALCHILKPNVHLVDGSLGEGTNSI